MASNMANTEIRNRSHQTMATKERRQNRSKYRSGSGGLRDYLLVGFQEKLRNHRRRLCQGRQRDGKHRVPGTILGYSWITILRSRPDSPSSNSTRPITKLPGQSKAALEEDEAELKAAEIMLPPVNIQTSSQVEAAEAVLKAAQDTESQTRHNLEQLKDNRAARQPISSRPNAITNASKLFRLPEPGRSARAKRRKPPMIRPRPNSEQWMPR